MIIFAAIVIYATTMLFTLLMTS